MIAQGTLEPKYNRQYKDSLFRILFSQKEELLSLYNAVAGTDYTNPNDLVVNTLVDVIYLSMKNDISFIIDGRLSLYEHQSTWNNNMPLRYLLYVANLYAGIAGEKIFIHVGKLFYLIRSLWYSIMEQRKYRNIVTNCFQNPIEKAKKLIWN